MSVTGKEIFGMLDVIEVELPFESEEAQKRADAISEELKALGLRAARIVYDWGYRPVNKALALGYGPSVPFKSGDLVTIFKTVSDGDILWSGTIDLDRREHSCGVQRGAEIWNSLFDNRLPARLEQNGQTIFGSLYPFCESGTEGIIWAVEEYGKTGYDGLYDLKNGDRLTVYSAVRNGDVEWTGKLDFGPEEVSRHNRTEVMRKTNHMDTARWLELSWQNRPIVIGRAGPG